MLLIKNNKFFNSIIKTILKKFYVTQHLKIEIISSLFLCVKIRALNKKQFQTVNFIYKLDKGH